MSCEALCCGEKITAFSERYVVNGPLLRSHFHLFVCLSLTRVRCKQKTYYRIYLHGLIGQGSGSVVKKNSAKIFATVFHNGDCYAEGVSKVERPLDQILLLDVEYFSNGRR